MKHRTAAYLFCGLLISLSSAARAQLAADEVDWKESAVPPPPSFDVGKLVPFEVSANSSLVFGVDPAAIRISQSDGLVRYVVVATSASGARNVMYEGIRCGTGEFKTYGRYSPEGRWSMIDNAEWRSMFGNLPSKHALRFAQAGACDNAAVPISVNALIARLKNPNFQVIH